MQNVFTETLPRNGSHNPVVLLFLGADRIENIFPYTAAYLEVFTGPLPGNVLIRSVTIFNITITKLMRNEKCIQNIVPEI
jgi:hypothetical protein